jgi:hypothetical protein
VTARKSADDDRGAERIAVGAEVRLPEQVPHAAVQDRELVVTQVLDDARDVAGEDGLVHRGGLDQREVGGVHFREVSLRRRLAGNALVDQLFQLTLGAAIRAGRSPFRVPRASRKSCCSSNVRLAGAIHQQIADTIEICANDTVCRCWQIGIRSGSSRFRAPAAAGFGSVECVHDGGSGFVSKQFRNRQSWLDKTLGNKSMSFVARRPSGANARNRAPPHQRLGTAPPFGLERNRKGVPAQAKSDTQFLQQPAELLERRSTRPFVGIVSARSL